jgi:hypothetical protein
MNYLKYLIILTLTFAFTNCSLPENTYKPKADFETYQTPTLPDYSKEIHWAALPTKKDSADILPSNQDTLKDRQAVAEADVFFIYPTIYLGTKKYQNQWNADVNNAEFNEEIDASTIRNQAAVFNAAGRIYAPRYRQAHLYAYFSEDTASSRKAFELAYQDVKIAFQYYLENYNDGRPIIIASHSQGTNHAERLLAELLDGTALQKQLVAAYLVGMPIDFDAFQHIYPCRSATELSCFCSWNTYSEGHYPDNYMEKLYRAVATNPINWTINGTPATAAENKGGVGLDYNLLPNASNAQSHRGMVWIDKPNVDVPPIFLFMKNWHIADYNLFWVNVRENAALRVEKFVEGQE